MSRPLYQEIKKPPSVEDEEGEEYRKRGGPKWLRQLEVMDYFVDLKGIEANNIGPTLIHTELKLPQFL